MRCRTHPRYVGKRMPSRRCPDCWRHFLRRFDALQENPSDFPRATIEPCQGESFRFKCSVVHVPEQEADVRDLGEYGFVMGLQRWNGEVKLVPSGYVTVDSDRG